MQSIILPVRLSGQHPHCSTLKEFCALLETEYVSISGPMCLLLFKVGVSWLFHTWVQFSWFKLKEGLYLIIWKINQHVLCRKSKNVTWFMEGTANILCLVQVIMYDMSCILDGNLILFIHLFLSKLTEEDVEWSKTMVSIIVRLFRYWI